MKISSSSILSPGRSGSARDKLPITLSTSLSRRLKTSRSIKGGAYPAMFPTTGKKRGCGFDNPEPSSPKVTCIGQVRVKSKKKHAKNTRTLSRRRSLSQSQSQHLECFQGQRNYNNSNQKWVHLPLTICEALRTFGSEVSCLFPCRSSCSSTTPAAAMEKEEKMEDGNRQGYCGAVFARWLVALQEVDGGGRGAGGGECGRDIELVAGDDDVMDVGNTRRHVFEDLEIVNDSIMGSNNEGRVSICVPPKNALLLMRCRSDPMKMEALANRFWEPNLDVNDEFDDNEVEIEDSKISEEVVEMNLEIEMKQSVQELNFEIEMKQSGQEDDGKKQSIEIDEEEESFFLEFLFEENEDHNHESEEEDDMEDALEELFESEIVEETETRDLDEEKVKHFGEEIEDTMTEFTEKSENEIHEEIVMESESVENGVQGIKTGESIKEKVKYIVEEIEDKSEEFTKRSENENGIDEEVVIELRKVENGVLERENEERDENIESLPECLLLMMYEPKLSMEVSKETWVCSSDFIRPHSGRKKPPPPQQPPVNRQDDSPVNASSPVGVTTKENGNHIKTVAVQYESGSHQPARSSCSYPTRGSMAAVLEEKLLNTMGFEPMVLTRCNSEPMRTATTKLNPDSCYWKNKLEPPRRASFGLGMSGLGF